MQMQNVSISALMPGDGINSRKHDRGRGVKALVASIKASGLQQPLVVRAKGEGRFEIIDGNTRFEALKKIAGKKDTDVPVVVIEAADPAAHEASFAANVIRTPLHPVDEFEAFSRLVDDGWAPKQVADRFAIGESDVRKRLQLANIAPEIRQAWRDGKIGEDQAKAFSSVPDHARQVAVWNSISKSRDEWSKGADAIRREMLRDRISQRDRRLLFVGADAYRAAGGEVIPDLFSESFSVADQELLDRLVADKIDARAKELIAEGWAWAATSESLGVPSFDVQTINLRPWMTEEEFAAFGAAKYDYDRRRIASPAYDRACSDPEARKQSGCLLSLGYDGELQVQCLRIMPANSGAEVEDVAAEVTAASSATESAPDYKPRVSFPLTESLSGILTTAIAGTVANNRFVALCLVTATLKARIHGSGDAPLRVSTHVWGGHGVERNFDVGNIWIATFRELLAMDQADVLGGLAVQAARLVDLTDRKIDSSRIQDWKKVRPAMVDAIAESLPADEVNDAIFDAFDPHSYFAGIDGATLAQEAAEIGIEPPKGKKDEKTETAAVAARDARWLPPELRTPHYKGPKGGEG